MSNHVHLLTRPKNEESLYKMMQGVTLCYTQHINKEHKRTGRLWESRYHSCIVDKEKYLWAAARYIEQNPIRAKIVEKAEDFPYSSARAHIAGRADNILGEELFKDAQMKDYIAFIRESITEEEMNRLKYSTRTGRPFGREEFIKRMEKKLDKRFILQRPGRPKGRKN
jgi:putative transposase